MSILENTRIAFDYAGLFVGEGNWIHPRRVEKTWEIIYVTKGEVHIAEGETEYSLSKGELLILSPETEHYGTKESSGVSFYWLHFSVSEGELPFSRRYFKNFESGSLFKEILHYNNLPQIPVELVNAVLIHILAELCFLSGQETADYNGKAEKIYEWARINASPGVTVSQMSKELGYSPDHLTRLCKKAYGVGVRELLSRFVISRAKTMLCNTDKYVKEIAGELGFADDKAFIGFFKYHEGCFPGEFRARFAKTHMNNK